MQSTSVLLVNQKIITERLLCAAASYQQVVAQEKKVLMLSLYALIMILKAATAIEASPYLLNLQICYVKVINYSALTIL
jgi:hypothetical protein